MGELRDQIALRPALAGFVALLLGLGWREWPPAPVLAALFALMLWRWQASITCLLFAGIGLWLAPESHPVHPGAVQGWEVKLVSQPLPVSRDTVAQADYQGRPYRLVRLPDGFSLGDTLRIDGVLRNEEGRGVIRVSEATRLERGSAIASWGASVRLSFTSFVESTLPIEQAAVLDGLCFNDRSELAVDQVRGLQRSGTIHVISTSGLHVAMVAGFLSLLLAGAPIPRGLQLLVLALLLAVYVSAAGLRPPGVRSALMAVVALSAYLFRRDADLLSALGVSGIALVLWDPWSAWDLGFQLSFAILAALGMFVPLESGAALSWPRKAVQASRLSFWASVVSTVSAAPLLLWVFGSTSWIGPVANALVVPLVAPAVGFALIAWLLSLVWPAAGALMLQSTAGPLAAGMGWAIRPFDIPAFMVSSGSFSPVWLVVAYAGMLLLWRPNVRPS